MNNKLVAIIPARGGSKGIYRKNIVDLGGFPLIAYTIAACKMTKNIDRIIISTEDTKIAEIAKSYGAEVPFMRPKKYSRDDSRDVEFLKHFFDNIDVEEVALMRPTTPFRNPAFVDKVIEKYFTIKQKITGLRSVNEINENPYKVFKIEGQCVSGFFTDFNGIKNYTNLPRQSFPKAYIGNGHVDIVKRDTVCQNKTFGDKIYPYICDKIIDIDSSYDLRSARNEIQLGNILLDFLKEKKNE